MAKDERRSSRKDEDMMILPPLPPVLALADDVQPAPRVPRIFVRDFVRVASVPMALGNAFVAETEIGRRVEGVPPSRLSVEEWRVIYRAWAAKPR
jgi:hypothetical protein